ncbi:MAG TPA: hypothetical protein DD379_21760, partial [Cyanobacteria bacterium UBA11162]|nr:hypothetical protein [Cyanobacteria bacterium UBA11162]
MKFTQRFATIVTVILACVMGGGLWLLPAENTHALVNSSSLSEQELYEIPKNPSLKGGNAEAFGDFAWKTFVALNWPAHCQGFPLNPLTEKEILQDSKAPRVWEFYSSPEDIFMPNRAKPDPKPVVIPPQCQDPSSSTTGQNLRLMESASEPIQLELALPEQLIKNNMNIGDYLPSRDLPSEPEQLEKLASNLKQYLTKNKQRYYFIDDQKIKTLLPDDKPLVDRAGNYVLNEVRMNDVEVDQILNNGWYSAANLAKFDNDGNPFQLMCSSNAKEQGGVYPSKDNRKVPCTENTSMGTIEIKAAWMILPQKNNAPSLPSPDPAKYYTTQRTLIMKTVEPSGDEKTVKIVTKKVTVPVALVGFHIIQKTSRTGWIWATFEQIDNVPEEGVGSVAPES